MCFFSLRRTERNPQTSAASTPTVPTVPQSSQTVAPLECDWSEHTCPDGNKYYYNCVTCESKWDKPEEYILFEQQLQKQQKLQNKSQQLSCQSSVFSTKEVAQAPEVQLQTDIFHQKLQLQQPSTSALHAMPRALSKQIKSSQMRILAKTKELDHLQVQSKCSPVVHPALV
ncbi:flowering time control protein FCA-like [Melia azedarach]|uniref:Flowering time control protein FCA-like n=1 Tax=Melia azedarach TaxID=155640 RepID=A0ACC1YWV6_MELAZ|nr:flowering time control protein FCA-like [Melia azedarach]